MTDKTDDELRKLCADQISFEESRVRMGVGNGNDVFADATHIARPRSAAATGIRRQLNSHVGIQRRAVAKER